MSAESAAILTADQALAQIDALLESFTHFGVELGLERIQRLLATLGNPEKQVKVVHVAGSNGKGSVCAYLSAVLTHAGYRVGRYTSPHLVSWCERICLNQQDIPAIELHALLQEVVAAIDPNQSSPTQFEVITAAAWLYFARQQVDLAIVEVGLGGRLDATNVCERPLVSVITSLSREHWQRLGPTLADISREKAGILKPTCPAVMAPQPPEAAAVLEQRLADLNCPAVWVQSALDAGDGWAIFQGVNQPSPYEFHELRYPQSLMGPHQLINAAVAIATLQILQSQWLLTDAQIVEGMAKTQWPGRLQWITWNERRLLIDGAHNPAGAEMLRKYLDTQPVEQPIHWVMGMIGTKDHADILKALLRPGDSLSLVPVPGHLPVELMQLETLAVELCPGLSACRHDEDVFSGLAAAAAQTTGTVVLCGSLYLIGHFLSHRPNPGQPD
jgi:dihydrofolate synthase / folylpolyglutamate synthase